MTVVPYGDLAELIELVDTTLDEVALFVFAFENGISSILLDFGGITGVHS